MCQLFLTFNGFPVKSIKIQQKNKLVASNEDLRNDAFRFKQTICTTILRRGPRL